MEGREREEVRIIKRWRESRSEDIGVIGECRSESRSEYNWKVGME